MMTLDDDFFNSLKSNPQKSDTPVKPEEKISENQPRFESDQPVSLNKDNDFAPTADLTFEPVSNNHFDAPPSTKKRQKSRSAKITMTKEEYRKELERLNLAAENKNYILLFGKAGSGKSYIIASLIHFMKSYLKGTVRMNAEIATQDETKLYNQMVEMFTNPQKNVGRTSELDFFELNLIYQPQDPSKKPMELTFIDASGEHFSRIYEGDGNSQVGELPDYLEVILESDVNCKFAFVYDQSIRQKEQEQIENNETVTPQVQILSALFDKIRAMQDKYGKRYPKILLLSKADKIPEAIKQKYGHSPSRYAGAPENELVSFANGYFSEPQNRAIFYSMGTFTKYDDLDKFDHHCPEKLFDWIYGSATGQSVIEKPSCFTTFKRWLLGR